MQTTTSKHEALRTWVSSFLQQNYLYFESAQANPGVRLLVPEYGDFIRKTDILGCKYKTYTFIFIGYETIDVGTSDVNIENMILMDKFNDWLVEQEQSHNYPNFGTKCSEYEIIPLQNMANVAEIQDDGLAKYMLGVRIDYKEE